MKHVKSKAGAWCGAPAKLSDYWRPEHTPAEACTACLQAIANEYNKNPRGRVLILMEAAGH